MPDAKYDDLKQCLDKIVTIYEKDPKFINEVSEGDTDTPLQEIIAALLAIGYTRRDIYVALNIEPLTFDRWQDGKGSMKPDKFRDFTRMVEAIIKGGSQRVINIADTSLMNWRYVFDNGLMYAKRIWYVTEGKFLLEESPAMQMAVNNLFSTEHQIDNNRPLDPVMIYLYPAKGPTQQSLIDWYVNRRRSSGLDSFRGSVIGIGITEGLSWFQPGIVTIILEKPQEQIEAYLRVKIADQYEDKVRQAFGIPTNDRLEYVQWLSVHSDNIRSWWSIVTKQYAYKVNEIVESKKNPFDVQMWEISKDNIWSKIDPETGNILE